MTDQFEGTTYSYGRAEKASYKAKESDSTLTGVNLETEILSQSSEKNLKEFKPSKDSEEIQAIYDEPWKRNRCTTTYSG